MDEREKNEQPATPKRNQNAPWRPTTPEPSKTVEDAPAPGEEFAP